MGNDGHFASLFPDSPELKEGLVSQKEVIEVSTPSSPFDRVSMTLNLIVKSNEILLLVFGEDKLKVLENPSGLPVEELLSRFPVKIIWAP
jgi:6-phosphogluconolactonase